MHCFSVRVYYEDTDAGGVVYYANYFKFAERARTEFLRSSGVDQINLIKEQGIYFVVHSCEARFFSSAKLDDLLDIHSEVHTITKTSLSFKQVIFCNGSKKVEISCKIACVVEDSRAFRPNKIPDCVLDKIKI